MNTVHEDTCVTVSGHYIVLCGYNLSGQKFLYHNPSLSDSECPSCWESSIERRMTLKLIIKMFIPSYVLTTVNIEMFFSYTQTLNDTKHSDCRNLVLKTEVVICPVMRFYAGVRFLNNKCC